MKVNIGETTVYLSCTALGKQALKTEKLTPRQRQFILLVEENSLIGEQAVANLLPKLDLQVLMDKGWITCDVSDVKIFKQPIAIAEIVSSAVGDALPGEGDAALLGKKSFDTKQSSKDLQSFLNTYATDSVAPETSVHMPKVESPDLPQAESNAKPVASNQNHKPQVKIPEALRPTQGQAPEDIMIVQSLLDD